MKPGNKTIASLFFNGAVIISLGALLSAKGCSAPGGAYSISGTIMEQFDLHKAAVGRAGNTGCYVSAGSSNTAQTNLSGKFGPSGVAWDRTSSVTLAAFNNSHGSIDEIYYNKLGGPDPNPDLQNQQFLLTTPDTGTGAIIPVIITAQQPDRTPYNYATVQINDSASLPVGTSCTTDVNGICTYGTQLRANRNYTLTVTAPGGALVTEFPFNTFPITGTSGKLCRLRLFARF